MNKYLGDEIMTDGTGMLEVLMPSMPRKVKKEKIKLVEWHKAEGDEIAEGDLLAVIETNKAALDIEAESDGTLVKILVAAGSEAIEAGTVLAMIEVSGAVIKRSESLSATTAGSAGEKKSELSVPTMIDLERDDELRASAPLATPLAKRIAEKRGIDLRTVSGSGAYGRILEKDIDDVNPDGVSQIASSHPKSNEGSASVSQAIMPSIYTAADVSFDRTLALCAQLDLLSAKSAASDDASLITLDSFVVKALAKALARSPEVNSVWGEGQAKTLVAPNVALEMSSPSDTRVLVLHDAARKSVADLSTEIGHAQAAAGAPSDCAVLVSMSRDPNVKTVVSPIRAPYAIVLSVGGVAERPVYHKGEIVAAKMATITLCADTRCVELAQAVEFIGTLKLYLEEPALML